MDYKSEWELGRWDGINVSIHWTALLVFPWLLLWFRNPVFALIGTVAYVLLHLVHEAGHVFVARHYKRYVESISIRGLHSHTEIASYGSFRENVFIAWGGVLAQLLLLAMTYLLEPLLYASGNPWLVLLLGPLTFMFISWNIFLMVVALLPIGPMDGHQAWGVIWLTKQWWKRRKKKAAPRKLTQEEREALEKSSAVVAEDIIRRVSRAD